MVLICIPVCYVQIKLGALFKRGIVGMFGLLVPILKGKSIGTSICYSVLHVVSDKQDDLYSKSSLDFNKTTRV